MVGGKVGVMGVSSVQGCLNQPCLSLSTAAASPNRTLAKKRSDHGAEFLSKKKRMRNACCLSFLFALLHDRQHGR